MSNSPLSPLSFLKGLRLKKRLSLSRKRGRLSPASSREAPGQSPRPKDTMPSVAEKEPRPEYLSLEDMWSEAEKAFEEICGESLKNGDIKNLNDVKTQISEARQPYFEHDKASEDSWERTKSIGLQILTYLGAITHVASSVSSATPFPAAVDITSKAIGFALKLPQEKHDYDEAIDNIFQDVSTALAEFKIYNEIDYTPLSSDIHRVLICLVKLCAQVVKHRQGRKRDVAMKFFTRAIGVDTELEQQLREFKEAMQSKQYIQGTVTLAMLTRVQETTGETNITIQAIRAEQDRPTILRKIGEWLSLPSTLGIDLRTTQTRTNISSRCTKSTGQWIWRHPSYCSWTGKDNKARSYSLPHVLLVLGPQSCGKTYTTAQITERLEQARSRTFVAHYFFSATTASKKITEEDTVAWALRYMAFQIARVDSTVRSSLDRACNDASSALRLFPKSFDDDLIKLWQSFGIGTSGSNATYYLIFDGLENIAKRELDALLGFVRQVGQGPASSRTVRILLSGRKDQFQSSPIFERVMKIQMGLDNDKDMPIIISADLAKRKILDKCDSDSRQDDFKNLILEVLPTRVDGNYAELQLWLDRIAKAILSRISRADLYKLLHGPARVYEEVIESLERTLTPGEIDELNEILKHVMFRRFPPALDELEAALSLRTDSLSPQGLGTLINTKYSPILKFGPHGVEAREGFQQHLAQKAEVLAARHDSLSEGSSSISMTLTLNNVDPKHATRYFWDLTQMAMQTNFTFDNISQSHGHILVNEFESHLALVNEAFSVLRNEQQTSHEPNSRYLISWLPYHLSQLRELENESSRGVMLSQQQREIGAALYSFFTDDSMFQRNKATFGNIVWSVDEMTSMQEWLVHSGIMRQDEQWLKDVLSARSITQGYLKRFAKSVITEFLSGRSWDVYAAYRWVEALMIADDDKAHSSQKSLEASRHGDWEPLSDWCWNTLNLSDSYPDSLWYERLAKVASIKNSDDLGHSLRLYGHAIEKENPSWLCYRDMGIVYYRQGRTEEAIEKLEVALRQAQSSNAEPKPEPTEVVDLLLRLGDYAYKISRMDRAEEYYISACNISNDTQVIQGLSGCLKAKLYSLHTDRTRQWILSTFTRVGDLGKMRVVLETMTQDPDQDNLFPMLITLLKGDPDMLQSTVDVMMLKTLRDSSAAKPYDSKNYYQDAHGILLYYAGIAAYTQKGLRDPEGSALSVELLWIESREQLANIRSDNAITVRSDASSSLARHYFQLMLKDEHLDYRSKIEKLKPNDLDPKAEALGLLVAHHTLRDQKGSARKQLKSRLKLAMDILSDDTPDNDTVGLYTIHMATAACQDLENAAIAASLLGQPDLVTEASRLENDDIEIADELNKVQVLEMFRSLAKQVTVIARLHVQDDAAQDRRIQVAKSCIEYEIQSSTSRDKQAIINVVYDLIRYRLHNIDLNVTPQWYCGGRTADGRHCTKQSDFSSGEFYHCLYCWDRNFCRDCLCRLRDPACGVITVCNAEHKWLVTPTQGSREYVGPRAKNVRRPSGFEPVEGDNQILAACYDKTEEAAGSVITVEEWIRNVKNQYGLD